MKKIPKFLYHGITQFNYEILKHCNFKLYKEFLCYDDLVGGFSFALKRAMQLNTNPVLLIIDSEKNKVMRDEKTSYSKIEGKLQDFLALSLNPNLYKHPNEYEDVFFTLWNVEARAKELSDFMSIPETKVLH